MLPPTSHTSRRLSCSLKSFKVISLSLFVGISVILLIFLVFLKLSPVMWDSKTPIGDCLPEITPQKQQQCAASTDKCIPCVFSASSAIFLSLASAFCAITFCFFLQDTAFSDPGYLEVAPFPPQRAGGENNNDDGQELIETQNANAASGIPTSSDAAASSQPLQLKFKWKTASGKSALMVWNKHSPTRVETLSGEGDENGHHQNHIDVKPRIKYCQTCGIHRPPRASHSRVTGRCVRGFDHYCTVSHSDIGEGNVWSFRFMLFSATALVIMTLVTAAYTYSFLVTKIPPSIEKNNKAFQNAEILSLLFIIICSFAVFPLTGFSLFFFRLAFCLGSMTWREFKKKGTVFISHDFATQFDDPCSNCIRTIHCGQGGTCGEVVACCCGVCNICGQGAEGEGPTIMPNQCCQKLRGWMPVGAVEDDEEGVRNVEDHYTPGNLRSESYVVVPRPCVL